MESSWCAVTLYLRYCMPGHNRARELYGGRTYQIKNHVQNGVRLTDGCTPISGPIDAKFVDDGQTLHVKQQNVDGIEIPCHHNSKDIPTTEDDHKPNDCEPDRKGAAEDSPTNTTLPSAVLQIEFHTYGIAHCTAQNRRLWRANIVAYVFLSTRLLSCYSHTKLIDVSHELMPIL